MHAQIQLGSLRRALIDKLRLVTDAGETLQMPFEEVHPCPDDDYMHHHKIKKFLDETSLDSLGAEKRALYYFR